MFVYDTSNLTPEQQHDFELAQAAIAEHGDQFLSKPNVVGLGVGFATRAGLPTDQVALVVMVADKLEAQTLPPDALIPRQIDGVRVDVQPMGTFSAGG